MTTMTTETKLPDTEKFFDNIYGHEAVEDGLSDLEETPESSSSAAAPDGGQPRHSNLTSLSGFVESLDSRIKFILDSARLEHFENGFQSEFGRQLKALIREDYKAGAVTALSNFILQERLHPEVAAEALKALGEIQDETSHMYRRTLLERSLKCSSPIVRDAAVDAIESLGDKDAVGSLIQAATQEQNTFVRRNLDNVIQELQQG